MISFRKFWNRPHGSGAQSPAKRVHKGLRGVELVEPRCVLAVTPIDVGAVYSERDAGTDVIGDLFEITFQGGAAGTQLRRLIIDGDQNIAGFSIGDVFFDTRKGGLGADDAFEFSLDVRTGIDRVTALVEDGTSRLVLEFEGFDAGETLRFFIDVDEVEDFDGSQSDPNYLNDGFDPITSGVEFQNSRFTTEFSAADFYDVTDTVKFRNQYDDALADSGLNLPPDDFQNQRNRTAGAFARLQQQAIPATLNGYVYHDRNNNGQREAGEEGIPGTTIRVVPLQTVDLQDPVSILTDANGFYSVTGLMPGTYRVVEATQPGGYLDGRDTAGLVDGVAAGTAENDLIDAVFLRGGSRGVEYNFGELLPVSISGHVHLSTRDGDCFGKNVAHEPVAGATILLVDSTGKILSQTTTDEYGAYRFEGLYPSTYGVIEVTPAGLINGGAQAGTVNGTARGLATDADTITQIVLASGQSGVDYDFCEHVPSSLSGRVYHDRDNDGARESGETGIAGVTVSLFDDRNQLVATTITNVHGDYEFSGLRSGNYSIVESQPSPWIDGKDVAGTVRGVRVGSALNPGDRISQIQIGWGDQGIDYDFGEYLPASLSGRVQLTTRDNDCFSENIEHEPVVGAIVRLLDAGGNLVAETVTDANGAYRFSGLDPGAYTLVELTPDGLIDGGAQAGTVDGISDGQVTSPGTIVGIDLSSGQTGLNYLFCEHQPATLGGVVYHDRDQDGIRDEREEGIGGVIVELRDTAGSLVARSVTDAEGRYEFHDLHFGTYDVVEIQPQGWLDGLDTAGTIGGIIVGRAENPGDAIRQVHIGWGDNGKEFNFGENLTGSISGRVHVDIVLDCQLNPAAGEYTLQGVTIQLLDRLGQVVATTVTDANGMYEFLALAPGAYTVQEVQPAGFFNGKNTVDGTQLDQVPLVVGSGQAIRDVNFCEIPPTALSGFVFQDGPAIQLVGDEALPADIASLRNGVRTVDDKPLPGVVLELRNGITGASIMAESALPGTYAPGPIQTITDARGFYQFAGLRPGTYAVFQVQPNLFVDGVDTPGTLSGFAFNPGQPVPQFVIQSLTVDPQSNAIVRISLPPGSASLENNFSEVVVERTFFTLIRPAPPTPLPPPRALPIVEGIYIDGAVPRTPWTYVAMGDGGDNTRSHTWHLSVIDGGSVRGDGVAVQEQPKIWLARVPERIQSRYGRLEEGSWSFEGRYGLREKSARSLAFGLKGAIPISGDFNGDGFDELAMFFKGEWFIDVNGNGQWDSEDLWARLGGKDDYPVVGDWDGDGKDDIGIYGRKWNGDARAITRDPGLPDGENDRRERPKNIPPNRRDAAGGERLMQRTSQGQMRADLIDHVFQFGSAADRPVVGDWNGDGITSIGVFREGIWYLDVDGDGSWTLDDKQFRFGRKGDAAMVGDWNGDGISDPGVYRQGVFILDTNGNCELDAADRRVQRGSGDDYPVSGDWDGDGKDQPGVYRAKAGSAATRIAQKAA